ncbi:hypothetical protein COX08_04390 [Candidatus Beckwithbacteria bacterium CG23_combo_of_CG06-09_8_20_14_all_34_8]|uniref:DUF4178 domain-containing protein n=1 Tax=Candidatus Beckwithbacteria bacterium CG23_combo_of_CG06-09_8_20_14_all_34_8 TaxID=1974497 RepID=A0A2H0B583_9BACT|nr:MAG: hypothetical protein COX08_04390 [Candidatus Beckwithbacteria bacterium CG23_combo_of_CG06-09_8_20_14_all_34_8]
MISTKNFVKKAQVSSRVKIGGEIFTITEIIKWKMLRCGQFYHKYSLLDQKGNTDYKFAEDPDSGKFIFVKIFKLDSQNSFAPTIEVEGKKYTFSYGEICQAEWTKGGNHKKGDLDIWCDYENPDGSYVSLGTTFPGANQEDLIGRWVEPSEIKLL